MSTPQTNTNFLELLSTLSDACYRGCQVIRAVHQKRIQLKQTQEKGGPPPPSFDSQEEQFSVQYKVANDPRSALTEADLNAQLVIVDCIRSVYGNGLRIIGEEDQDSDDEMNVAVTDQSVEEVVKKYQVDTKSKRSICRSILEEKMNGSGCLEVPMERMTIYIDPLDGTREFVEGRVLNVQCLIGIIFDGKPVGGVVGLPFTDQKDVHNIEVVCGLNNNACNILEVLRFCKDGAVSIDDNQSWMHAFRNDCSLSSSEDETEASGSIVVFTGDSNRIHKKLSLQYLEKWTQADACRMNICVSGGCGNKILRTVALASIDSMYNAIAVIPPGTCSWDTAAPSSILLAAMKRYGIHACVSDMLGGDLVYDTSQGNFTNDLGVLVSCGEKAVAYHHRLIAAMRGDSVMLDSLLKKYWNNFDNNAAVAVDDEETAIKELLKKAQGTRQNVGNGRNKQGRMMKCQEIQSLISEQIDIGNAKLIGYAMPEGHDLTLFWRKDKEQLVPTSAVIHTQGSATSIVLNNFQ